MLLFETFSLFTDCTFVSHKNTRIQGSKGSQRSSAGLPLQSHNQSDLQITMIKYFLPACGCTLGLWYSPLWFSSLIATALLNLLILASVLWSGISSRLMFSWKFRQIQDIPATVCRTWVQKHCFSSMK